MRLIMRASVVAVVLAATIVSVSASGQSARTDGVKPAPASTRFVTLNGVKAVPMASDELKAVKGLHIHFVTPSQNDQNFGVTGLQLVNRNNTDNWSDLYGDGPVGPGYHGLCGAALNSPMMFIPGQDPVTGHGGGC